MPHHNEPINDSSVACNNLVGEPSSLRQSLMRLRNTLAASSNAYRVRAVFALVCVAIIGVYFSVAPQHAQRSQSAGRGVQIIAVSARPTADGGNLVTLVTDNERLTPPQTWQDGEGLHIVFYKGEIAAGIGAQAGVVRARRVGDSLELLIGLNAAVAATARQVSVLQSGNQLNILLNAKSRNDAETANAGTVKNQIAGNHRRSKTELQADTAFAQTASSGGSSIAALSGDAQSIVARSFESEAQTALNGDAKNRINKNQIAARKNNLAYANNQAIVSARAQQDFLSNATASATANDNGFSSSQAPMVYNSDAGNSSAANLRANARQTKNIYVAPSASSSPAISGTLSNGWLPPSSSIGVSVAPPVVPNNSSPIAPEATASSSAALASQSVSTTAVPAATTETLDSDALKNNESDDATQVYIWSGLILAALACVFFFARRRRRRINTQDENVAVSRTTTTTTISSSTAQVQFKARAAAATTTAASQVKQATAKRNQTNRESLNQQAANKELSKKELQGKESLSKELLKKNSPKKNLLARLIPFASKPVVASKEDAEISITEQLVTTNKSGKPSRESLTPNNTLAVKQKPATNLVAYGALQVEQEIGKLLRGLPHRVDVIASRAADDRQALEMILMKHWREAKDETARRKIKSTLEEYGYVARWCASLLLAHDAVERVAAARTLGELQTPAGLPFLLEALYDRETPVRTEAVIGLGALGMPAAIGALLDTARRNSEVPESLLRDALARCSVLSLNFDDEETNSSLLTNDAESNAKLFDVSALSGDITGFEPIERIEQLPEWIDNAEFSEALTHINAAEVETRVLAARNLAQFHVQRAVEVLAVMSATDTEAAARAAAVSALGAIDHEAVFNHVLLRLNDDAREVRAAAARSLTRFSFDRADAYVRVIQNADAEILPRIAHALTAAGFAAQAIERLTSQDRRQAYESFSLLSLAVKGGEFEVITDAIALHKNLETRLALIRFMRISSTLR